jgi:hypothetical protein
MTQHTLNGKIILVMSVPEDASDIQYHKIQGVDHNSCITYFQPPGVVREYLNLPGSWELLGRLSEITQEKAQTLVESKKEKAAYSIQRSGIFKVWGGLFFYKNYEQQELFVYPTALESLQSWCRSKGVGDDSVLLIKK